MTMQICEGPAIVAGYEYRLQIEAESELFLAGCRLVAHARAKLRDAAILAALTSENGGLQRICDTIVEIVIPASATRAMPIGDVVLDIVRIDLSPPRHLGFMLEIPVMLPVTRDL